MTIDPSFDALKTLFQPPEGDLASVRNAVAAGEAARRRPGPSRAQVEDRRLPGPAGDVPVRLYRPGHADPVGALIYFHGGGFVVGGLDGEHDRCVDYAEQAGCLVVSVDYRLAPENPFPAASDDGLAVLTWLAEHAATLGVDPRRIALGGASAGGAIAAGLALRARDLGRGVCFVLLVQPALDHLSSFASARTLEGAPFPQPGQLGQTWRAYLGSAAPSGATLSYAAPFSAETLAGFPPTCLMLGGADPLRDEGMAFARRLLDAGSEVELHVVPGAPHGLDMVDAAALTRSSVVVRVAALNRAFTPSAPARSNSRSAARNTLIAASVAMALSILPVFAGTFPLFLNVLTRDHVFTASTFTSLLLISAVSASLANVAAGWAVDRFGPKAVSLPGVILFGLSIAGLSWSDRLGWGLYPLCVTLGVAAAMSGPVAYAKAIAGWFEARRGVALSVVVTAAPMLSAALMAPVAALLIDQFGWRGAYQMIGGVVAIVGAAVLLTLFRDPPVAQADDLLGAGPGFGVDFGKALSRAPFWMITLAVALGGVVASGVSGQMLTIATEVGVDRSIAVLALSAMSGAGLLGALASGVVVDRLETPRSVAFGFLLAIAGVVVLRLSDQPALFLTGCALLGAGNFAAGSALPYLMGRFFGIRRFGKIFGACVAVVAICSAAGPLLFGIAQGLGLGLSGVLNICLGLLLLATFMILSLRRYPEAF